MRPSMGRIFDDYYTSFSWNLSSRVLILLSYLLNLPGDPGGTVVVS